MDGKRTHPGTAAVKSFLFNGLGQIYNGQIKKGLLIIFLSTLSIVMGTVVSNYFKNNKLKINSETFFKQ